MTKRNKIDQIRKILNNPQEPKADLSKWTDDDLRWIIATGEKYDMNAIDPDRLDEGDLKAYNVLIEKYEL